VSRPGRSQCAAVRRISCDPEKCGSEQLRNGADSWLRACAICGGPPLLYDPHCVGQSSGRPPSLLSPRGAEPRALLRKRSIFPPHCLSSPLSFSVAGARLASFLRLLTGCHMNSHMDWSLFMNTSSVIIRSGEAPHGGVQCACAIPPLQSACDTGRCGSARTCREQG
jgi:hypothetical protein